MTLANLSILKTGKARAIRFSTPCQGTPDVFSAGSARSASGLAERSQAERETAC